MSEWVTTCRMRDDERSAPDAFCLVVLWSAEEPHRVGEVAFLGDNPLLLGRGGATAEDPAPRLRFLRRYAASFQPTGPILGSGISRRQCVLCARDAGIEVEQIGRCPQRIDGKSAKTGLVPAGSTLMLRDQLVLSCVQRSERIELRHFDAERGIEFGEADRDGIVGESAAIWELREALAAAASSDDNVLILGESGTGRELSARAIHRNSSRAARAFVRGAPARPGLFEEAAGGTLFFDGELPPELEEPARQDVRLIASTERDLTELGNDLLQRFPIRVQVPSLRDRPEDVPLLVRHILRQAVAKGEGSVARFFSSGPNGPEPRLDPDLILALVAHPYADHVRELEGMVWQAINESHRAYVALSPALRDELVGARAEVEFDRRAPRTALPTPEEITACLNRNGSHAGRAADELGLRSRYALTRLLRQHGIVIERRG